MQLQKVAELMNLLSPVVRQTTEINGQSRRSHGLSTTLAATPTSMVGQSTSPLPTHTSVMEK